MATGELTRQRRGLEFVTPQCGGAPTDVPRAGDVTCAPRGLAQESDGNPEPDGHGSQKVTWKSRAMVTGG